MDVTRAYDILNDLVTRGYVTASLSYQNTYLVLKTVNENELTRLEMLCPETNRAQTVCYKLALSTFSVNGECVLLPDRALLPVLAEFYETVNSLLYQKAVKLCNDMMENVQEALRFLEGYCYTEQSRYLWKIWKNSGNRSFSGIPGLEVVGRNAAMETWVVVNGHLDAEEHQDLAFNNALFIASSMNGKGADKISRTVDMSRRERDEHRKQLAKYGYDAKRVEEKKKENKWTAPIDTREDLVRELYRQMRGEKDLHDLFIEKWLEKQRAEAEKARLEAEKKQKEFRESLRVLQTDSMEDSRPVSAEEMRKIRERKSSKDSTVSPVEQEMQQHLIDKINARVIRNG